MRRFLNNVSPPQHRREGGREGGRPQWRLRRDSDLTTAAAATATVTACPSVRQSVCQSLIEIETQEEDVGRLALHSLSSYHHPSEEEWRRIPSLPPSAHRRKGLSIALSRVPFILSPSMSASRFLIHLGKQKCRLSQRPRTLLLAFRPDHAYKRVYSS